MVLREEVRWWIETAKRDLERAERALREGDRGAAVFWAHQAAEKALKAVLLAVKGWFPRTHSVRRLFEELGDSLGLKQDELEAAYELTKYYHVARYPDIVEGVPDEAISEFEARRAVSTARRVVRAAEEALEELARRGEEGGNEA